MCRAGRRRGHFDSLLKRSLGRFAGNHNFTARFTGVFSQHCEGPQGKEVREHLWFHVLDIEAIIRSP